MEDVGGHGGTIHIAPFQVVGGQEVGGLKNVFLSISSRFDDPWEQMASDGHLASLGFIVGVVCSRCGSFPGAWGSQGEWWFYGNCSHSREMGQLANVLAKRGSWSIGFTPWGPERAGVV